MRILNPRILARFICATLAALVCMSPILAVAQSSDEEIGAPVAEQVETEIGIYEMPGTSDYVEAIGSRLVGNLKDNKYTFRFHIVDQFDPNAFAVPGGWVYVSRGLLVLANSEDELAGVIGHEIIGIFSGVLQIPGAIVGAVVSEDLGALLNAPINTIGQLSLSRYSRSQESESDRLGMKLAARSGYDPAALADILSHLEADVEMLTGEKHKPSFFDSHPTTPDRVEEITAEAQAIEWSPKASIASDRQEFLSKLDGIWYDVNPAQGVFQGDQFYQPDMGFTIAFPEGWTTLNTPGYVGAYAEDERAVVLIGVAGNEAPATYAERFVARLKKEHEIKPQESRAVDGPEWTGYYVIVEEDAKRGGEKSYLRYLWARINGVTYQLIGACADRYREDLRNTALSLRPLAEGDWKSIYALRVRVVEAKDGERLGELGERTGNRWTTEYAALINDLPVNKPLKAGQLVKIARQEHYRP
jgi:predicted Zn-dependent protease